MPGIEIKGRSKIANYRHGGRTGKFGGGRTNLLEQLGRVEAEPSNRNRRAEISRVHGELNRGYAKGGVVRRPKKPSTHKKDVPTMAAEGGRAGHALGHTAGRLLTKTLERVGGGSEKKPHSTRAGRISAGVRKIKRGLSARQRDKWGDLPPWRRDSKAKGVFKPKGVKGKGSDELRALLKGVRPNKRRTFKTHGRDVPTMAAEGGRIGLKKGGSDKKWIQKAVNPKHKGYCTPMTKKTCTPARKALARTFKKKAKTGW